MKTLDKLELVARPEGSYEAFMDKGLVCRTSSDFDENPPDAPALLANPARAEDGRLMYYEHQVQRCPLYNGPLKDWPMERVRELLEELIYCTGICSGLDIQLPPAGLPGHLHSKYDPDEPAAQLLAIGLGYVSAIAFNERRSMHNRWQEAKDFIYDIEKRAREAEYEKFIAAQTRQATERQAALEASRQSVYFIGSESGPIKIGIAINVQNRLKGLQTGHHERLALLATCEGGQPVERAYHERFAARRLAGEWFERCPEIEVEINRLNAKG